MNGDLFGLVAQTIYKDIKMGRACCCGDSPPPPECYRSIIVIAIYDESESVYFGEEPFYRSDKETWHELIDLHKECDHDIIAGIMKPRQDLYVYPVEGSYLPYDTNNSEWLFQEYPIRTPRLNKDEIVTFFQALVDRMPEDREPELLIFAIDNSGSITLSQYIEELELAKSEILELFPEIQILQDVSSQDERWVRDATFAVSNRLCSCFRPPPCGNIQASFSDPRSWTQAAYDFLPLPPWDNDNRPIYTHIRLNFSFRYFSRNWTDTPCNFVSADINGIDVLLEEYEEFPGNKFSYVGQLIIPRDEIVSRYVLTIRTDCENCSRVEILDMDCCLLNSNKYLVTVEGLSDYEQRCSFTVNPDDSDRPNGVLEFSNELIISGLGNYNGSYLIDAGLVYDPCRGRAPTIPVGNFSSYQKTSTHSWYTSGFTRYFSKVTNIYEISGTLYIQPTVGSVGFFLDGIIKHTYCWSGFPASTQPIVGDPSCSNPTSDCWGSRYWCYTSPRGIPWPTCPRPPSNGGPVLNPGSSLDPDVSSGVPYFRVTNFGNTQCTQNLNYNIGVGWHLGCPAIVYQGCEDLASIRFGNILPLACEICNDYYPGAVKGRYV
jgi:hypothetical protein